MEKAKLVKRHKTTRAKNRVSTAAKNATRVSSDEIRENLLRNNPDFELLSDEEQKRKIKAQRNRVLAQQCRDKKKRELIELKSKLKSTISENG